MKPGENNNPKNQDKIDLEALRKRVAELRQRNAELAERNARLREMISQMNNQTGDDTLDFDDLDEHPVCNPFDLRAHTPLILSYTVVESVNEQQEESEAEEEQIQEKDFDFDPKSPHKKGFN